MAAGERTLYEVLGISPAADAGEIKRAWRSRLLEVHPDHGGSVAETLEVQAAYSVLSDPISRAEYDGQLAGQHRGPERPQQRPTSTRFDHDPTRQHERVRRLIDDLYSTLGQTFLWSISLARKQQLSEGVDPAIVDEWVTEMFADAGLHRCAAMTKEGRRCLNAVASPGGRCHTHTPAAARQAKRCRVCGSMRAIVGADRCWHHATQTQRDQAIAARPVGKCVCIAESGKPCRAAGTHNHRCYQHGPFEEHVFIRVHGVHPAKYGQATTNTSRRPDPATPNETSRSSPNMAGGPSTEKFTAPPRRSPAADDALEKGRSATLDGTATDAGPRQPKPAQSRQRDTPPTRSGVPPLPGPNTPRDSSAPGDAPIAGKVITAIGWVWLAMIGIAALLSAFAGHFSQGAAGAVWSTLLRLAAPAVGLILFGRLVTALASRHRKLAWIWLLLPTTFSVVTVLWVSAHRDEVSDALTQLASFALVIMVAIWWMGSRSSSGRRRR